MSRLFTFYLPPSAWHSPYTLENAEAHHLAHVLRVQAGQHVRLFDGYGRTGQFLVHSVARGRVQLECLEEQYVERKKRQCYLAVAWSKALRRGWFLEKCVELGVAGIFFWAARHSQGETPPVPGEQWFAQLVSAGKQSGNPWLPVLSTCPGGLPELLEHTAHIDNVFWLWEKADQTTFEPGCFSKPCSLFILGPEGGLAQQEIDFLVRKEVTCCSLGENILRWETAALLVAGLHSCLGQSEHREGV